MIASLQLFVLAGLAIVVFVVQVWALVDAARRPAHGFTSEGRLSKPIWLLILGVAALLGFLGLPAGGSPGRLGFLNIIAVVAAIVYLADMRPKLRPYGNGKGRRQGPSGW
ncbi:hypothetical protein GCM10009718_35400 [Isoptericola halotolerans]|uniref:DUF2516 family protein n=1 Tax=Isoptericola halotolerans TaxID=300560 RepID=A0ABX2A6F1_9MICO|nr:hypothetical protein [Isoptericola halotolerans]